ncbi:MAG: FAD-binding oxidoreductase [Cytophagaceae bacterium]
MEYKARIVHITQVTHDTKSFILEKPDGYKFIPGNATEVSINKEGFVNEKRAFTFTSLNDDQHLEFIIKIYKSHNGVTKEFGKLKKGDELIIGDSWGVLEYKGPGYFIAGGAGITPFIAILRQLKKENKLNGNKLLFSNKTSKDIILIRELIDAFGKDVVFTLTGEDKEGYDHGYIDERFLKKEVSDFHKQFYLCGPPAMVDELSKTLAKLGASPAAVIFEN